MGRAQVRLDPDVEAALTVLAEEHERSLSAEVNARLRAMIPAMPTRSALFGDATVQAPRGRLDVR